jgi:hypothetical protein
MITINLINDFKDAMKSQARVQSYNLMRKLKNNSCLSPYFILFWCLLKCKFASGF